MTKCIKLPTNPPDKKVLDLQKNGNMKNLSWLILLSFFEVGCLNTTDKEKANAGQPATAGMASQDTTQFTSIQWIDSTKNLGKIYAGQNLQVHFRFKNTGNKPLVIQSVTPSCGCTVADYPKKAIAPGEESEVTGAFDSKGREGLQQKNMTVVANTKGNQNHVLRFEVEVLKAKS